MDSRSNSAIILTVANGVNFLINFITLPFLARSLSYENYGVYGQILIIGSLASLFFCFGIPSVVNVIAAQSAEYERKVFANANLILLISSLTACLVIGLLISCRVNFFGHQEVSSHLVLYIPFIFFTIINSHLPMQLIYYKKAGALSKIVVFCNTLKIVLFFLSIYYFRTLGALFISLGIVSAIEFILYNITLSPKIGFFRLFYNRHSANKLFKLSIPMFLTGIFGYGVLFADSIIIASMMPIKDFAIYRNGAIEIPFVASIYASVSAVLLPDIARLYKKGEFKELLSLKRKASTNVAALIFPIIIFFIVNGNFFITSYLSHKYVESAIIFSLFNLATLVRITDYQDIFLVSGNSKKLLFYYLIAFVVSLTANIILIKLIGLLGAVVSYLLSVYILLGFLIKASAGFLNARVRDFFNLTVLIKLMLLCICMSLIVLGIDLYIGVFSISVAATLVYFFFVYKLILRLRIIDRSYIYNFLSRVPYGKTLYKILT